MSVLVLGLFALTVVLPNAFKAVSISLLVGAALILLLKFRTRLFGNGYFAFLLCSVPVTLFYLWVGYQNNAPDVAMAQIPVVYVLTPLLWGMVCCGVRLIYPEKTVVGGFVVALWLAGLTVLYFFVAYMKFGPDAVRLFAAEPDVGAAASGYFTAPTRPNLAVTSEGFVAATMQVYGSLIFVVGGLFAAPGVIRNPLVRFSSLAVAIAIALTSGRSALVLAIPIGTLVYGLGALRDRRGRFSPAITLRMAFAVLVGMAMIALIVSLFDLYLNWSLTADIAKVFEKLSLSGDEDRKIEAAYLWNGILDTYGLGAGHGVPAAVIRLPQFPWRYELLWIATLYRVGVVGAAVYAAPFVVALWRGGGRLARGQLSVHEQFLFGGFLAAFAASNSNPYLEGFVFQWMVVLPLAYFLAAGPARRRAGVARPFGAPPRLAAEVASLAHGPRSEAARQ